MNIVEGDEGGRQLARDGIRGGQLETRAKDKREQGSVWQRWRGDFLLRRLFSEGIRRTELLGDRQSGG